MEEWRDIPNYSGRYLISSTGIILSLTRGTKKIIRSTKNHDGYLTIRLVDEKGVRKTHRVHRLVALAFIGESELQVNHIDGIRDNNNIKNLEYVSPRENSNHRRRNLDTPTGVFKNNCKEGSRQWFARIRKNGRYVYLGSFYDKESASKAYKDALEKDEKYVKKA